MWPVEAFDWDTWDDALRREMAAHGTSGVGVVAGACVELMGMVRRLVTSHEAPGSFNKGDRLFNNEGTDGVRGGEAAEAPRGRDAGDGEPVGGDPSAADAVVGRGSAHSFGNGIVISNRTDRPLSVHVEAHGAIWVQPSVAEAGSRVREDGAQDPQPGGAVPTVRPPALGRFHEPDDWITLAKALGDRDMTRWHSGA